MDRREMSQIEEKAQLLARELDQTAADSDLREFLKLIHRPGWTTPAESLFVHGILDSLLASTRAQQTLRQALFAGAAKVALNPQPLPPEPPELNQQAVPPEPPPESAVRT